MKRVAKILCVLAVMSCPALAEEAAPALDLNPPEPTMFAGGSSTPYRNDPPGTYYGDTTHPAADGQDFAASRCPTAPDGSQRSVTGAATMGMGWSSRGGSSQYRGLDLNYCKETVDDEGESRVFNASLHVDQIEGDGIRGGSRAAPVGRPPGPPPRGRR
jgi:hypothetical protein